MSCVDVPAPSSPLSHSPSPLLTSQNGIHRQGGNVPPSKLNPLAGDFNPGSSNNGSRQPAANQGRGRGAGGGRGGLSSAMTRGGSQQQITSRQPQGESSAASQADSAASAGTGGGSGTSGSAANSAGTAAAPAPRAAPGGASTGGTGASGRTGAISNANHLLNFQYESARGASGRGGGRGGNRPGSARGGGGGGSSASASAGRRYPAAKPQKYDKNKFLQANFRFLVSDAVDVSAYEADADKMFDWDDVLQVEMATAAPVQCPISLDSPPLCPQITPCGHIFSFPAIMHHLMNHGGEQLRRSAPCPLCFAPVVARELRLVRVRRVVQPRAGDQLTLALIRRTRTSIIPQPEDSAAAAAAAAASAAGGGGGAGGDGRGGGSGGEPASLFDRNPFAKFVVGGEASELWRAAAEQLAECAMELVAEGGRDAALEAPYVYGALDQLAARARRWAEHRAECLAGRGLLAAREGAGSSPEALGAAAEAQVKKMFTAAVSDVTSAREAAVKLAALDQQFPSLAPTAGAAPATQRGGAATAGGGSPSAAKGTAAPAGSIASAAPPAPAAAPAPASAVPGDSAAGAATAADPPEQRLPFDAAFSEDEQEDDGDGASSGSAAALAAGDGPRRQSSTGAAAASAAVGDATAAVAVSASPQPYLLGASTAGGGGGGDGMLGPSPPSGGLAGADLMGTSPTTTKLNTPGTQGEFYTYQAADGSWVFLHPLNLRCLLHHHGSYDACPPVITGRLLELEDVVQSDATRRRWRFLSHLPLSGAFKLCELAMTDLIPAEALAPFADELSAREKRRRRQRADERRQAAAEAAAAARAAAARLGPSADELAAMPSLNQTIAGGGAPGGGSGAGSNSLVAAASAAAAALARDMQLSPSEVAESIALQASIEDAAAAAMAAAAGGGGGGGVSFAHITKMGYAATGPALGSSPPPGSIAAAVPPAPSGAWGARAAATGGGSGGPAAAGAGPSSPWGLAAGPAAVASPGPSGPWGAGKGVAGIRAAAAASASPAAALGKGPAGGDGDGAVGSGSKKGKAKGTLLFSTGNQRKY